MIPLLDWIYNHGFVSFVMSVGVMWLIEEVCYGIARIVKAWRKP